MVKPSFNHRSRHVALVTVLPDQLCANSCAISDTKLLSPAITVGVINDKRGFSIPPNGKEGGKRAEGDERVEVTSEEASSKDH